MQSLLTREYVFSDEQTVSTDYKVKLIGLKPEIVHHSDDARGKGLVIGCENGVVDTEKLLKL